MPYVHLRNNMFKHLKRNICTKVVNKLFDYRFLSNQNMLFKLFDSYDNDTTSYFISL